MKNNSTIYRNPYNQLIFDLSQLGTVSISTNNIIKITQEKHLFQVGDILYYDIKEKKFSKAFAINDIQSEVCGVVSEVLNNDNFIITGEGLIETNRYEFDEGTILYLSDVYPGKLVSIPPSDIIKQIATQATNGIIIDIQRGYKITNSTSSEILEAYTKEELDEIIKNIW